MNISKFPNLKIFPGSSFLPHFETEVKPPLTGITHFFMLSPTSSLEATLQRASFFLTVEVIHFEFFSISAPSFFAPGQGFLPAKVCFFPHSLGDQFIGKINLRFERVFTRLTKIRHTLPTLSISRQGAGGVRSGPAKCFTCCWKLKINFLEVSRMTPKTG
ncbi:MAG: hypothetical protein KAW12_09045 [Candidatus Aminicenantes bacterium]|nr:hypothetical protein [Candidatus Aminicenantes bacterium]